MISGQLLTDEESHPVVVYPVAARDKEKRAMVGLLLLYGAWTLGHVIVISLDARN